MIAERAPHTLSLAFYWKKWKLWQVVLLMGRSLVYFLWSLPQVTRSPKDFRSVAGTEVRPPITKTRQTDHPHTTVLCKTVVKDGCTDGGVSLQCCSQRWTCVPRWRLVSPEYTEWGPRCPLRSSGMLDTKNDTHPEWPANTCVSISLGTGSLQ